MRKPDFFLLGHPRSGSGQLNGYLARHPDLFMAKKELHYFGSDLGYHTPPRSEANFLSFFEGCPPEARAGEASTWYLFSERAAEEIQAFNPQSKVIALLRNPVDVLHSLHAHFVFRGDEDIPDFAEALAAEADRAEGRRLPPYAIPRRGLEYSRLVRYAEQLQRYFDVLGRDRVHVVINDDFRKDPQAVFKGVCQFLGVRDDYPGWAATFEEDQRARNANRTVYSRALQDFLIRPEQQQVLEAVRPAALPGWRFILRALRRVNIKYVDRAPMDPTLRAQLQARFAPEVRAVSELLGRDLSRWSQPK